MNTEITVKNETQGWIFYDEECSLCIRSAARVTHLLEHHGFFLLPLQTPGAAEQLRVTPDDLLAEMQLLTPAGQRLGGADAVLEIARHIWWAWPLVILARLPGVMPLCRRVYACLAAKRYCSKGSCQMRCPRKTKRVFFEMP